MAAEFHVLVVVGRELVLRGRLPRQAQHAARDVVVVERLRAAWPHVLILVRGDNGLAVPAIQNVRAAGTRNQTINNLGQLGTATHNFAGTYNGKLPQNQLLLNGKSVSIFRSTESGGRATARRKAKVSRSSAFGPPSRRISSSKVPCLFRLTRFRAPLQSTLSQLVSKPISEVR